ncbi:AEC family transporter [Paracoccus pacificus]|uniref:AEC family transporter n=1 Tax=Paracoccus pacificus TaxID=1463598 RepID=A0ABW4R6D5_9RHOB
MHFALMILPTILVILCGHFVRRYGIVPAAQWPGIETLSFRVLFPAILIVSILHSPLQISTVGPMTIAVALAFAVTGGLIFVLHGPIRRAGLDDPGFTTLFQTALRFNGLLVLALASDITGPEGLALISVVVALTVPVINIVSIVVLARYGRGQATLRSVAAQVARNPMVQGCGIGVFLNLSGIGLPDFLLKPLEMMGQAALAVGLLAVGAGIQIRRLWARSGWMWLGIGMRLLFCPAVFLIIATAMGLSGLPLLAGLITVAMPTATAGFIIARQMGGDAELYADIMTWQTVLSALTIPIWLWALS